MMSDDEDVKPNGAGRRPLKDLETAAGGRRRGPPPVNLWTPPYSGEIDIRILRDGRWLHEGAPITREPLVRLFGSILRFEDDGRHYLVTPVEKWGIEVEDAPFIGVDVFSVGDGADRRIEVLTNHGDRAPLGPDHPIRSTQDAETGGPATYIRVRDRLEARLDRKSFYRLVDLAEFADRPEGRMYGVWSQGRFFALAPAAEIEEALEPRPEREEARK